MLMGRAGLGLEGPFILVVSEELELSGPAFVV